MKLKIEGLSAGYDKDFVIKDLSLSVNQGEFLSLLGPSGCGKTTLMKAVAGILPAQGGRILLDGEDITGLPIHKRGTVIVFQDMRLFPHMTVEENVAFPLKMQGVSRSGRLEQARDLLEKVQMGGFRDRRPSELSGGQQQRAALARALAARPRLLLLDEPFSALDAKIRAQMREELKRIQEELNITVVFVTHDQEEAMALSHRIVVMNKGFIEQIGTPTEIYDHPATRFVASFIGEMNFLTKQDGSSVAVRPEDVTITRGEVQGQLSGDVRTIMVLGHFVEVNVEVENRQVIKTYVARNVADQLHMKDRVSLSFAKTFQYCA